MIRGVIFDMDGVLVDAVLWHYQALNRALSLFGYRISEEENRELFNGLPTRVKLELLSLRESLPRRLHPFLNEMKQRFTREIIERECRPNPELTDLLKGLRSRGLRLAVASNSIYPTVELVLERMRIQGYFDVILSSDDVKKNKPDPEIYHLACSRLNLTPDECLIIEDAPPGVRAAQQVTQNVLVVTGPHEVTTERLLSAIEDANQQWERVPIDARGPGQLEIVIPMAGLGQRFAKKGYDKPKPLISVHGKPMIQWVVENVRPTLFRYRFTFVCNRKHFEDYQLTRYLSAIAPGCRIIPIPNTTEGAACTILLASEAFDESRPLLIVNSDQWVETGIDRFLEVASEPSLDGLIMTFPSQDPKWSYARVNEKNLVFKVAEKEPISSHATVGIYYFRRGNDFLEATQNMIRKDLRVKNEFYVCPVFNQLIGRGKKIGIYPIPASAMHSLGTPEDLDLFLTEKKQAA